MIRDVRDSLYSERKPPMNREKSILLQPEDAAKIMNTFHNRLPYDESEAFRNANDSGRSSSE